MSSLNPKGGLAIAQIAFYAPAFCVAAYVVFRQGFSRQLGWIYLNTLSILRLIGASCLLYAEVNDDYSDSLLETAGITSAIGTAPLLLVLLGFLERVHVHMRERRGTSKLIFQALHFVSLAGFIVAIIGGVNLSSATSRTSSTYTSGKACMEAGSILFMALYIALAGITILTHFRKEYVAIDEYKLVLAGLIAIPFLLVRILYTVLASFQIDRDFAFMHEDVFLEAFMQFLMEAIVVAIFIVAGLLTPRMEKPARQSTNASGHHYGDEAKGQSKVDVESDDPSMYERPQRNLMDYRPSKLIKDAISRRS